MDKKTKTILGVVIIVVIIAAILFIWSYFFIFNNGNVSEDVIKSEIDEYLLSKKDSETESSITKSGSALLYDNNKVTYITKSDKVYEAELENNKIKSFKLSDTKEGQFYNSVHPEKHIPTGFKHTIGDWNTGYVIEDSEKNEFVWIPVASSSSYKKRAGHQDWAMTVDSIGSENIEEEVKGDKLGVTEILGVKVEDSETAVLPEAEIVNKAGGFWLGRYEAGVDSSEEAFDINWEKAKVLEKANVQPARCVPAEMYLKIANNWKSGKADSSKNTVAFQSGLVTGTQWDVACEFIGWDIANSDCSEWGCYASVQSQKYTGYHSSDKSSNWIYEENVVKEGAVVDETNPLADGKGWVFPTGKFVNSNGGNTSKKNIFDMAGNVWEWTTEIPIHVSENSYVVRGGCAGDPGVFCASARYGGPWYSWNIGFRMVLYVE